MKKLLLLIPFAGLLVWSCNKKVEAPAGSGQAYLDLPATPLAYYTGGTATVNYKATLGRVLFYDNHLSVNNGVACASCHQQTHAFADNVAFSRGYENKLTHRNSLAIQDLGTFGGFGFGQTRLFWDGRAASLQTLVPSPISNHVEMGIADLSTLSTKLATLPYYSPLFKNAYGTDEITLDKISECISYFLQAISAGNSRFDRAQAGVEQLTAQELRGQQLFNVTYNCGSCHHPGQSYSGENFADIGLDATYTDDGLGEVSKSATDRGLFRVPNLHNVALTAPYMHDGRYPTLDDVIDHYSNGIAQSANLDPRLQDANHHALKLNITTEDKAALIAFLGTLTDYSMITDTRFSTPFRK